MAIKERDAYSTMLKLFTFKDGVRNFMSSNLQLVRKKKNTVSRTHGLKIYLNQKFQDGDMLDNISTVLRIFTTPVRCQDEQNEKGDFLDLLLEMYGNNKLVNFPSKQSLASVNIMNIANNGNNNNKGNRKKAKRSRTFGIIHNME